MTTAVVREKDCPFLLRVFTHVGGYNHASQYTIDSVPKEELSLYTWKNATLEELAQLIEQVIPEARDPDARIAFRLVYLDVERAKYQVRDIGRVVPAKPTEDQKKTLEDVRFFIGDYLDVAVFVGPPPNGMRSNRALGGRDGARPRDGGRFNNRLGGGNGDKRNFGGGPYNRDNKFGARPQRRGDRF